MFQDNYRYIHTVILENLDFGSYSYYVSVPKENKTWYSFDVFDAYKEKVSSKSHEFFFDTKMRCDGKDSM